MICDINVAGSRLNAFAVHGIIKGLVAVFRTPDRFHILLRLALHASAWEGQVTHGNAQRVVVFHLFMQLVAVATGDVGEDGDNMFFLRRFVDDHLFFQRIQVFHQHLVGDIHRLRAAHIVQRPLKEMFAIFGDVQHAAAGHDGFHSGNGRRLNVAAGDAKLSQRLFNRCVIRMRQTR